MSNLADMSGIYKKLYAIDLALNIVDGGETDVTEEQVRGWRDDELYDWLETGWNYEWDGRNWRPVVEVGN